VRAKSATLPPVSPSLDDRQDLFVGEQLTNNRTHEDIQQFVA